MLQYIASLWTEYNNIQLFYSMMPQTKVWRWVYFVFSSQPWNKTIYLMTGVESVNILSKTHTAHDGNIKGIGLVPMDVTCSMSWGEGIETPYARGSSGRPLSIAYFLSLLLPFWFIDLCLLWQYVVYVGTIQKTLLWGGGSVLLAKFAESGHPLPQPEDS